MASVFYSIDDKTGELEVVRTVGLTGEEAELVLQRAVQHLDKGNPYPRCLLGYRWVEVLPACGSPYWGAEAVKETAM